MSAGWEVKTLGELCEVIAGQSPEGKFYNSDGKGLPFYQGKKDFGDKFIGQPTTWTTVTTKLALPGDILMSVRAPVGPVNFAAEKSCIGRGLAAIRAKSELDRNFLFYQLIYLQPEIAGKEGAVFASINKSEIAALQLAHPPLAEQQRIVAILDEAFEGIATARKHAEQNLQNAKALFESHLEAVFSQKGEGWVEKRLEEVCNLLPGYAFKSADYINASNTLNIRMSNIRPSGSFDSEHNQKFLPDSYAKKYSAYSLYEGDLIIAMTDMAGDPKILGVPTLVSNLNSRNFLMNQRVGKLFDFTPDVCQRYLRYFLTSPSVKKYYKTKGTGGLQINICKGDILSVVVPLPNVEHQDCVTEQLDALTEETNRLCDIYTQKIAALDALKKSLLHQAFSGEL